LDPGSSYQLILGLISSSLRSKIDMANDTRKNTAQKNDEERRKELADFLKIRRARVKPPENGYFHLSRRRTPGLRREEVAEMTGVSASWYTWLEQGRDIRPSSELLTQLSKALRLDPFETNHLFNLAGRTPPEDHEASHEKVPEALEQLVTKTLRVPAFVLGERFDFLIWNQQFTDQFIDLEKVPKERRTWLDIIFIENAYLRTRPDWRETARRTVAEFRWSVGKQVGSPWVKDLVTRMCKEGSEFAQLWKLHDVRERKTSRVVEIQHEELGKRAFLRSFYIPAEAENLRLVILTPVIPEKNKKSNKP
jgi:transcriptional regulator with XRE-family HTH domain